MLQSLEERVRPPVPPAAPPAAPIARLSERVVARLTVIAAIASAVLLGAWSIWIDEALQRATTTMRLHAGEGLAIATERALGLQDQRDFVLWLALLVPLAWFALFVVLRWALRVGRSGHAERA